MENCPKCQSETCVKDSMVQGRQRYRCKGCSYRHTVKEQGLGAEKKTSSVGALLRRSGV